MHVLHVFSFICYIDQSEKDQHASAERNAAPQQPGASTSLAKKTVTDSVDQTDSHSEHLTEHKSPQIHTDSDLSSYEPQFEMFDDGEFEEEGFP